MLSNVENKTHIERQYKLKPIAYIMSRFPKLSETFILGEILELEKQGQPVVIFPLLRVEQPVRHAEVDQLMTKVQYTPFLSLTILLANFHYLRRSPRQYLKTLWSALRGTLGSFNLFIRAIGIFPKSVYLTQLIEKQGIQHVHAHFSTHPALAALIISELTGISFSFTVHAHDIFVRTNMLDEKIKKARFIVTVSEFNKQYLLRLYPETPADKIKVIHCGVELERYKGQFGDKKGDQFTILSIASLQPYKGVEYLVKACAILRSRLGNFRCLIVGEGNERKKIEHLIAGLNLQKVILLLGSQPQDRVASLLSQADLFVLPSVVAANGQMEGIPVSLMEAMASGLPVVTTRLSGIPELVHDGVSGLLVSPGDERALADAIVFLYQRESLRQGMGDRGREKVAAEFELTMNVAKLRSLFSVIFNQKSEIGNWKLGMREQIRERVPRYFPDLESDGSYITIDLRQQASGHDSEIYEVIVQNGQRSSRELILKLHRPAAWTERRLEQGRNYALREYEALSFLWHEFSQHSDRLTVPRPLDIFPEFAALLMEKCHGERLDLALRWTRLLKTRSKQAILCKKVRECGGWLGLFHRISERARDPGVVYQRIEQDFSSDLEMSCGHGLNRELAHQIASVFEGKKNMAFSGNHKIVGHHCDFGPYNIFLSPDRVTVVDFEGFQDGIIYDDVCYFLGMIESMPFYHLSCDLSHRIKESFLEGYAQYENINREELDLFMPVTMVKIMARSPLFRESSASWRDRWKREKRLQLYTAWFEEHV